MEQTNPNMRNISAIVGEIGDNLNKLFHQELSLIRAELTEQVTKWETRKLFMGMGLIFATASIFLVAMALVNLLDSTGLPPWGCYSITALFFLVVTGLIFSTTIGKAKGPNDKKHAGSVMRLSLSTNQTKTD